MSSSSYRKSFAPVIPRQTVLEDEEAVDARGELEWTMPSIPYNAKHSPHNIHSSFSSASSTFTASSRTSSFDLSPESTVQGQCRELQQTISTTTRKRRRSNERVIEAFIKMVLNTDTAQRQQIKRYYRSLHAIDLEQCIKQNSKGIIKRLLLYAMQSPLQRTLYLLRIAIRKMKSMECIIPVLCVLSDDAIRSVQCSYDGAGVGKLSLSANILKLTGDDQMLRCFLANVLDANRGESVANAANVENDVVFLRRFLYEENDSKCEEDRVRFVELFSTKSFAHIGAVAAMFSAQTNERLVGAVRRRFGSHRGIGMAVSCVVRFVVDERRFYGDLMLKAMQKGGGGHKEILFWRVIVDRAGELEAIWSELGMYDGGRSDVELYNLKQFIINNLHKKDPFASKLILQMCSL